MKHVGWATRFVESDDTFKHRAVWRKKNFVLWGSWKREGNVSTLSKNTTEAMNEMPGGFSLFAIGQNSIWKMHVIKVLTADEIKEQHLEEFIPDYYTVNQPCYCWYLIDNIEDYAIGDYSKKIFRSSGKDFESVGQIAGNAPWKVFVE